MVLFIYFCSMYTTTGWKPPHPSPASSLEGLGEYITERKSFEIVYLRCIIPISTMYFRIIKIEKKISTPKTFLCIIQIVLNSPSPI